MCLNILFKNFKNKNQKFLVDVVCKSTLKSPTTKLIEVQCSEAEKSFLYKPHNNYSYLKVGKTYVSLKFLGEDKMYLNVSLQRIIKLFVYSSKLMAICYLGDNDDLKCLVLRDMLSDVETVEDAVRKSCDKF